VEAVEAAEGERMCRGGEAEAQAAGRVAAGQGGRIYGLGLRV